MEDLIKDAALSVENQSKHTNVLELKSSRPWYIRLWYVVTNPILYIFTGKIRF